MKMFFWCMMLSSFANAHFDLERYAKLYRDKRAQYMEAKICLIRAQGPYIASRNAFIASTSVLTSHIPHNDTELIRRRLHLRHAQDSNGTPPDESDDSNGTPPDESDDSNDNINEGNASEALSSAEQQEQIYNDYIDARDDWLVCKHTLSMIETPYLAAREAYFVAANSYTHSLLQTGTDHLWAPVFSEDHETFFRI